MKLFFSFLITLLLSPSYLFACTCADISAEQLLMDSDAVVLAISTNDSITITREMSDEEDWVGEIGVLTEFEVVSDYKNTELTKMNAISPMEVERCGVKFKKDDIVILSSMRHPTTFEMIVSACSVSQLNNPEAYELMMN